MKKIFILIIVLFLTGCTNQSVDYDNYLELTRVYPHDKNSFTEGLFFHDNKMYETVGLYGKSKIYKDIDIKTGNPRKEEKLDNDIFAEGSVILNDILYVLTYKEHKILTFNPKTLEKLKIYDYDKEGWGLTTDGKYLIASDGTQNIYFMDEKLKIVKKISVHDDKKEISNINELEYIDGNIWANVWKENIVLIINANNGKVIKKIYFTKLINNNLKNKKIDVLNGIAYNKNKIYITGKYYPYVFEFKIKNK